MNINDFKPYTEKTDRYISLCFAEADIKSATKLIEVLFSRGIRTWFECVSKETKETIENRQKFINDSDLLIICTSQKSKNLRALRSLMLFYQDKNKQIIFVNFDKGTSLDGLESGITKNFPHISFYDKYAEDAVSELMHTEGFSQEVIGQPFTIGKNPFKTISLATFGLIVGLGILILFIYLGIWVPAASNDTVKFTDKTITYAARHALSAIGNAALTEDSIKSIKVLRLKKVPESLNELSQFLSLERIEIPQNYAYAAQTLLDNTKYEIALYDGGAR